MLHPQISGPFFCPLSSQAAHGAALPTSFPTTPARAAPPAVEPATAPRAVPPPPPFSSISSDPMLGLGWIRSSTRHLQPPDCGSACDGCCRPWIQSPAHALEQSSGSRRKTRAPRRSHPPQPQLRPWSTHHSASATRSTATPRDTALLTSASQRTSAPLSSADHGGVEASAPMKFVQFVKVYGNDHTPVHGGA
ncbi:uncharacterized protein LOC119323864 [Triticum dicoccoides]|uniref:uncharacterized protein LOC119323864 n=1 Tax=Triticum dicoccoides TaxID=85692 RepID=UPI001891DA75|nr:uncharacterized protein LOC119323864 [Triticum dicoccoides]